ETEEIVFRGTGLNGSNDWQTWEFKWSSQILVNLLKNIQDIIQSFGQFQNDQNFQDGDFDQNPPPFDFDNFEDFLDIKNSTRLGIYIVVYRDNNSIEYNLNFDYIELYPKFIGNTVHDFGVVGLDIVEKEMEDDGYKIFMEVATGLFFLFIIPLITLLYAISAVRDDIENHTIVYLITRPVTKAEILFYKFKGSFISAWIPIVISFSITFFIVGQKEGSLFIHLDYLGTFLILITLSILTYGVIFFIFSLITSYPIVLCLLYVFFWELVIPNQQNVINRFSIMFHIQSIADGMLGDIANIELYQPLAVTESLFVLCGVIIGFFVLAIIIFNNRDFT
ncbi:MAG: ABC transporter permease subunit, partial [Thermoplasmata archaeon]|nr:ABC transporter permease subunit [Thermoplasmata archaeon]